MDRLFDLTDAIAEVQLAWDLTRPRQHRFLYRALPVSLVRSIPTYLPASGLAWLIRASASPFHGPVLPGPIISYPGSAT
jgi:hypothetical protein